MDSACENEMSSQLAQFGYLNKRNCLDGGKKAKNSRWQTFWTELCGNTLRFFRDDSLTMQSHKKLPPRTIADADSSSAKLKLAGFRTLHNLVVKLDYGHERDHVFQVSLGDGSVMLFQAPSEASMLKWVAALNDVTEAAGIDSDAGIVDVTAIIMKQLEAEKKRQRISKRKTSQQSILEDDSFDAPDVNLMTDPRLACLRQQLRQREELLQQLEEQEKAFLDSEHRVTGPNMFQRVPFKATASQKYYLAPGHKNSLIKPGTKITVFGLLPNGRWRCQVEKEGFADLYCDAYGEPGLTIEINDKSGLDVKQSFARLSIVSEPGIKVASVFQKRPLGITKSNSLPSLPTEMEDNTDTARWLAGSMDDITTSSLPSIVIDSSNTTHTVTDTVTDTLDQAQPPQSSKSDTFTLQSSATVEDKSSGHVLPNQNSKKILATINASSTSLSETDEELIAKSQTKTNRMSAIDIGRMFAGLEVKLQQSQVSSGPSGSPYDQIKSISSGKEDKDNGIQVLALHGLFTAQEKKKSESDSVKAELNVDTETTEGQSSNCPSMGEETINPDDQTGYTGTYTIYQSVTRKTFPLIGSVPTCLLWELQQARESSEQPPSAESCSSPELSPAPSPITSPLKQRPSRTKTGLKLFSSPSLKRWSLFREQGSLGSISASPELSPVSPQKVTLRSPKLPRNAKEPISPLAHEKEPRPSLPLHMDIITETSRSPTASPVDQHPRHSLPSPTVFSWSSDDTSSATSRYSWSPTMKQRSASPALPKRASKGSQGVPGSPRCERRQSEPMVDPDSESVKRKSSVVRRHTSEISRRGFEIRRRIRSRGISLVVGSSSSSEDELADGILPSTSFMSSTTPLETNVLLDDSGFPKNQANRKVSRPRATYTMTGMDKNKVMSSPTMKTIRMKKAASLPRAFNKSRHLDVHEGPLSPSSESEGSTPTKTMKNFFSNMKSKMKGNKLRLKKSESLPSGPSRSPTPEVGRLVPPPSPVVNPPMNSRRTLLLEGTDKGYGFKVETCNWYSTGEQKKHTFVVAVDEDTPAFTSGLKPGDAILEIDGENVENADHDKVVAMLKAATGPIRIVVLFVDGVKRLSLQKKLNALNKKLRSKQKELWILLQRELVLSGDVESDEEEGSVDENGSDEGEEFEVENQPCTDEPLGEL